MVGRNLLEHPGLESMEVLRPTRQELNLSVLSDVEAYVEKVKPDIVVHCAGRVGGIQANMKNPVSFLVDNIDINRNVIGACYKAGVKKLLNLGTSCMYPRNAKNPLSEEMILQGELEPTNEAYAIAKIMAQRFCDYIAKEDPTFAYKTLIPCNLYGRFDHFDPSTSHMVPAVIRKIHEAVLAGSQEVEIWGDGLSRREFMYAGDFADCIVKGIVEFETVPSLMNVGLGTDYSINEYYRAVAEVIGYKGMFFNNLAKPSGMRQKLVSTSKLDSWGWKSQTSLNDGIKKTYQYYLSLKN
jgi:GDP-L-fucose synthase